MLFLQAVLCAAISFPGTLLGRKEQLAQRGLCACSFLLIICKTHTSKAVILKHGQCTINLFLITQLYFGLAIKTAAVMNLWGCRCSHIKNELCTVGFIQAAPAPMNAQTKQDDEQKIGGRRGRGKKLREGVIWQFLGVYLVLILELSSTNVPSKTTSQAHYNLALNICVTLIVNRPTVVLEAALPSTALFSCYRWLKDQRLSPQIKGKRCYQVQTQHTPLRLLKWTLFPCAWYH